MKLAAIYNVWDGVELLRGSMMCLKNEVDEFIIVYQNISNYGERYNPLTECNFDGFNNVHLIEYIPTALGIGSINEINKRNIGLQVAKEVGCTHFLHMDCDEYYEDFKAAKIKYFINNPNGGSVCKIYAYYKSPELRFENTEGYYVPFIHKLNSETIAGSKKFYPFYVDPTRKINEQNVIEISETMHHFSWVRKNIERKIRNSSANLARSPKLLEDYYSEQTKAGYYVQGFHQKLIEVQNKFNIKL